MATIPSFEAVLLEIQQSLGLESYPSKIKNKFAELGLELENHTKKLEEVLDDIFCALDMDEQARRDAAANLMEWAGFQKAVELHTWTEAADQRQVLWHLLGYSYAPGLARRVAFWNLGGAFDKGMPGGQFWFLPQMDPATNKMKFPVEQVVEWLMDLMGLPMDQAKAGLGGKTGTDIDSIERNLYNWRNGQLPQANKIGEYFHDGVKQDFRGMFDPAPDLTEEAMFNAALDFVRGKCLDAELLRAQIPMTQPGRLEAVLDGSAPDEEKQTFIQLLQVRYAKPTMRTIRQSLLVARMVQDGYLRLLKFLCPGMAPTCTDPQENKLLQLIWIFQLVYNLTIEAWRQHGPNRFEESGWFESHLPLWHKAEIFLSILPSRREKAYLDLAEKLSRRFAKLDENVPLEDLFLQELSSIQILAERNLQRLRDEVEEKGRLSKLLERVRSASPWRALQAQTSYWLVSQVALNPDVPRKTREMAIARMVELSTTANEKLGAISVELGFLLNCRRAERPEDARRRVESLLQEAMCSPAYEFYKAHLLQYQAKHHLAQNEFDQTATCFRKALEACSERNFGPLRGEIARDAFATAVANRRLVPGEHEMLYRNMLAYGMFEQSGPALEDAAVAVADYFWEELYQPYTEMEYRKPLASAQSAVFISETFPLIQNADWDGLAAWLKSHAKDFKEGRLREVRGDTVLMSWLKMRDMFASKLPHLKAMTPFSLSDEVAKLETHLDNWRIAIGRMAAAWPKLVNLPDWKGQTPLMFAADRGDEDLLRVLLDYGAELDCQDYLGRSALHAAVTGRSVPCLDALLERGADMHKVTVDGQTALHTAVRMGFIDGVRNLVVEDAGLVFRKNELGQTAEDLVNSILADWSVFQVQMAENQRRPIGSRHDYEVIAAEFKTSWAIVH